MKVIKEWSIDAPWGKLALISWGTETGAPVLLVHGRQDSAATFEPMLKLLPDTYHYVALDLPGNGRSDPLPPGVMMTRLLFVSAVEAALRHLRWPRFVFVGHSMGCEAGLFFNAVHPQRISKLVLLDPGPALVRLLVHDPQEYFQDYYQHFYDNYDKFAEKRIYSQQRALAAVMAARGFDAAQAQLALSRSLVPVGDDLYELTWDRRLKCIAPPNYPSTSTTSYSSPPLPPCSSPPTGTTPPRPQDGRSEADSGLGTEPGTLHSGKREGRP